MTPSASLPRLRSAGIPLALLLTLAAAARPVRALPLAFLRGTATLETSKPAYWRYEMVDFRARAPRDLLDPAACPLLEVDVFKDGRRVEGLPGQEACLLRYDPDLGAWHGRWPVPWNPQLGNYEARLAEPDPGPGGVEHVFFAGPGAERSVRVRPGVWIARTAFLLRGRDQAPLPPAFCAMTLEPGNGYSFPAPEGFGRGPLNAFAWARFMGADAFWQCALQTAIWPDSVPADFPWNRTDLAAMRAYAAASRREGIAYGAYLLTFLVEGDFRRSGYQFTLSYDARTDSLEPIRFVSMADTRRQRDLVAALKTLGSTPGVDYVGMDYVRSNTGGLEFTDEFLSDFGLEVPAALRRAPVEARRLWLGRHLALDRDRRLHELWDWWRSHRVAEVLKAVLGEAHLRQPVWVFSLGWQEGHQHGQDPRMLVDAGVGINAPMFYEADQDQFPIMLGDWRRYLATNGGRLVVGEVVDSRLLHPRPGLNGPEEHYLRQLETLDTLGPELQSLGFFWHDLNRAVHGGRGPEGMREWALAGAAAFSRLKEHYGVEPLGLEVESIAPGAGGLEGRVVVRNLGTRYLARVRVAGVWTPGLGDYAPRRWVVSLAPGQVRGLPFRVGLTPRFVPERYRAGAPRERMVAFRAEVLDHGAWTKPDVAFLYFKSPALP